MRWIALLSNAVFLASSAGAADTPPAPQIHPLSQMIPTMCPALVNSLVARRELTVALGSDGLKAGSVCGCANERFLADREVQRITGLSQQEFERQAPQQQLLKSYVAMRAVQSILGCLSEELKSQLGDVVLPLVSADIKP